MDSLFKTLQDTYPGLPKTKKKIARYFLENYKEIPFRTVTELAEELDISDTSIVKYCKQLGFNGYGDFRHAVSNYVMTETSWGKRLEQHIDEMKGRDVYTQVFQNVQNNVIATFQNDQNISNFSLLIDEILRAEGIYIIGYRSSAILARYLSRALGEQGFRTVPLTPENCDVRIVAARIKPGDLLISFSFARYAQDTIDVITRVTEKGVKHIAFTDTPLSPAARHADRFFIISNTSFHNTPSLSGAISFIDAILAETAQRDPDRARTRMKEVEEFFGGRDMYSSIKK
ncbi:MAG: MurR/RpiR family transcriptional regulator [Lachnospiraceae bacterium]|nr:MurR/RpiR family transcriptional regulator [Lachnospiraceae bacterium]